MKIKDVIEDAYNSLSEIDLAEIRKCHAKDDLIWFHNNIGRNIRNDIGLWENKEIIELFTTEKNISHPDDISVYILEEIWDEIQSNN